MDQLQLNYSFKLKLTSQREANFGIRRYIEQLRARRSLCRSFFEPVWIMRRSMRVERHHYTKQAAYGDVDEQIRLLLDAGANAKATTKGGKTALDVFSRRSVILGEDEGADEKAKMAH
ncbi:hypothetical protein N8T08_008455 [Aspergillus melleus]|uniref:Uncharacterized protein n=1 Tax=Aspergillus melleus TaxID=138277 RepID=A0ACC3AVS4_9EURO|nr:hypothetical protein N8T08_008455 [Aspergillus melleus]